MAGAIPSILHQKIKFRVERSIVTINGEEDVMVVHTSDTPYIEVAEEVDECAFRTFEIAEVNLERRARFNPHAQTLPQMLMMADG